MTDTQYEILMKEIADIKQQLRDLDAKIIITTMSTTINPAIQPTMIPAVELTCSHEFKDSTNGKYCIHCGAYEFNLY